MRVAPYVALYLLSSAISLALAIYGGRRWRDAEVKPFVLLMAATAYWAFCHALSASNSNLAGILFWAQAQYAGIVLIAPLWLLFALVYSDRMAMLTPLRVSGLLTVPALAFVAVLTNGWHGLWWPSVALDTMRPFGSLTVTRGPLFWLHTVYAYGCTVIGLWLFVRHMWSSPSFYRRQAGIVVLGALFPVLGNIGHLLGMRLQLVDDPTPFLFALSGAAFYYGAIRYHLLDLTPVAQREVFESIPDGVVVLDFQNRVVAHNAAAPTLLGIDADGWIGLPLSKVVAASPLQPDIASLFSQSSVPGLLHSTYTLAGEQRSVELRVQPLSSWRGKRAGTLLLLHETTERVRAQWVLERRLAELTLLNQTAQSLNAAVHTEDVLRTVTSATRNVLQWDRIGIGLLQPDGVTLRVLIDYPQRDSPTLEGRVGSTTHFRNIAAALNDGHPRILSINNTALYASGEGRLMRRLGLATVLVVPLKQQTQSLGALLISSTTLRNVAPEELRLFETIGTLISEAIIRTRLYEEAQNANELKSVFLATVSHELRTPLTSILGFAEMMALGVFGMPPEAMLEPIGHIRRNSKTLHGLINDLLDFSRMEAGYLAIDLYPVNVTTVLRDVVGALQPQIYEQALHLELDVPDDLPLALANSMRLQQVLTNLLINAIKFTEHGTITVKARHDSGTVQISVRDTGIGIAAEHHHTIFQAFYRMENDHTRRHGGAGLGLAISKRLIMLMHGDLMVESAPGQGSTFTIMLPTDIRQQARSTDDIPQPSLA